MNDQQVGTSKKWKKSENVETLNRVQLGKEWKPKTTKSKAKRQRNS